MKAENIVIIILISAAGSFVLYSAISNKVYISALGANNVLDRSDIFLAQSSVGNTFEKPVNLSI